MTFKYYPSSGSQSVIDVSKSHNSFQTIQCWFLNRNIAHHVSPAKWRYGWKQSPGAAFMNNQRHLSGFTIIIKQFFFGGGGGGG